MNPSLGLPMVQRRAMVLIALLMAHASVLPVAHASVPPLTDAGETQVLPTPLVMWEVLYDGSILTVDEEGNVSKNLMTGSGLTTVWTVDLDVSANAGRIDNAQELLTVAHQTGVYVIQLSSQAITWNVSSANPVNDAAFDPQGDLWLVHFAGKRRAEEYRQDGPLERPPPSSRQAYRPLKSSTTVALPSLLTIKTSTLRMEVVNLFKHSLNQARL